MGTATVQLQTVSAGVMSGEMVDLNRVCEDHIQINKFHLDEPLSRSTAGAGRHRPIGSPGHARFASSIQLVE